MPFSSFKACSVFRGFALMLAIVGCGSFSRAQSRTEKSAVAQQELLDLRFFYKGRGMMTPPGIAFTGGSTSDRIVLGSAMRFLNRQFGLIVRNGKPVGLSQLDYEGQKIGVIGCAICHAGKAAGVFVPGLGNKNIDLFKLATAAKTTWSVWEAADRARHPHDQVERAELRARALHFLNEIGNEDLTNQTQGLIPIGIIRKWFYDQAGTAMDTLSRGQVKVPFLWGYGEKRKFGSFSDGFGYGVLPGWAIAVELVAGQTPEAVREFEPKIHHAEDVLADLSPPKYPFAIDRELAGRGQAIFERTCAHCHGTYSRDAEGVPVFQIPRFIPYEVVRTDPGRLEGVTPFFREMVRVNPLNDLIRQTDLGPGYIAPRLDGAWARFPYLHNGSVPTLFDLLRVASERPKAFSLRDAGERSRFDESHLGLTKNLSDSSLASKIKRGDRSVYDTSMKEHSNRGHEFGFYSDLTDDDRFAIVEYAKTL
jgi:mono/diheme cytochrome c family protein